MNVRFVIPGSGLTASPGMTRLRGWLTFIANQEFF
jgi:hypothetical protein